MKNGPRNLLLASALLCAITMISHGRIFERSGAVADSTRALISSGGSLAYESSITVNGGKGELAVVGFNKSIPSLVRELSRLFNTTNVVYAGGTMGFITAKTDGFVLKLTLLKLGNNNQALVFKIAQSETDSKASATPPAQYQMKDIPSFPGSEPVFFAKDDKSNAGVAVAQTTADATSVHDFYTSKLTATGWSTTLPQLTPGNSPGMLIYSKGREICCIMVDTSPGDRKNRITLLHKQQGIE